MGWVIPDLGLYDNIRKLTRLAMYNRIAADYVINTNDGENYRQNVRFQ